HFDLRVLFLEIPPDAGHRSAGTDADDEMRDPAVGLFPDLRPRLLVVRRGIRQVVVLIRFPRVRNLRREAIADRIVRPRIFSVDRFAGDAVDPDHRRVADDVKDAGGDFGHHGSWTTSPFLCLSTTSGCCGAGKTPPRAASAGGGSIQTAIRGLTTKSTASWR